MNFSRYSQSPSLLLAKRTLSCACVLAVVALASSCRAPFLQKTYNVSITQYGLGPNSVASDVMKEEAITPTLKVSAK